MVVSSLSLSTCYVYLLSNIEFIGRKSILLLSQEHLFLMNKEPWLGINRTFITLYDEWNSDSLTSRYID